MTQDTFQRVKERFADASDAFAENRARMVEDLKFSNPADPQQWDDKIREARNAQGMPCFTFDQTNQYIAQVVNDSRMNKPQIQTVPASSGADQKVSDVLDGMIRQIEYASNASIAYDTAQEHAARTGRGWFRIVPEVVDSEWNLQELRIRPVVDCLSVIPGEYTLPTGEDMQEGWVITRMSKEAYRKKYGKKRREPSSWKSASTDGWFGDDDLRIAEYFEVKEESQNRIVVEAPETRERMTMTEDEYWALAQKIGFRPPVVAQYTAKKKYVEWSKLDGDDFIEDATTFPSKWIPLIPVHGYEIWIEGKRYLCGMPRRMRDAMQAYNMERSAYIQMVALQPKAPYLAAFESIEQHEESWAKANTANLAYLPYNALASDGTTVLPPPTRQNPPPIGSAYFQNAQQAQADLQASIGMYRANLGAPSNETSGIAIKRREQQGDTANFHYIDNLARSLGHGGRILVDAIPTIYADSEYGSRDVSTLGIDGTSQMVVISPDLPTASQRQQDGVIHINPRTGSYEVRVKVGPAYANLREELSARLTEISSGNPALGAALAPLLVQMMDMPEAEKVSKICLALLPPNVQQAYDEDGPAKDIPPQVAQQMQQLQMQGQQMQQLLQQQGQELQQAQAEVRFGMQREQAKNQSAQAMAVLNARKEVELAKLDLAKAEKDLQAKILIAQANNDAKRDVEELKGLIQVILEKMQPPPGLDGQGETPVKPEAAPAPAPAPAPAQDNSHIHALAAGLHAIGEGLRRQSSAKRIVTDPKTGEPIGVEPIEG